MAAAASKEVCATDDARVEAAKSQELAAVAEASAAASFASSEYRRAAKKVCSAIETAKAHARAILQSMEFLALATVATARVHAETATTETDATAILASAKARAGNIVSTVALDRLRNGLRHAKARTRAKLAAAKAKAEAITVSARAKNCMILRLRASALSEYKDASRRVSAARKEALVSIANASTQAKASVKIDCAAAIERAGSAAVHGRACATAAADAGAGVTVAAGMTRIAAAGDIAAAEVGASATQDCIRIAAASVSDGDSVAATDDCAGADADANDSDSVGADADANDSDSVGADADANDSDSVGFAPAEDGVQASIAPVDVGVGIAAERDSVGLIVAGNARAGVVAAADDSDGIAPILHFVVVAARRLRRIASAPSRLAKAASALAE
jgi:hypothetical protein